MASISELLGKRIKNIRETKNIKQVELANMIDIEPTNLSNIEKGVHFPKDETLNKIIKALDIDLIDLFCFEHIHTKTELLDKINKILEKSKIEELQFFYKMIVSYFEISHT